MNKVEFKNNIEAFLIVKGFEVNAVYIKVVWNFIKDKLNDESFSNACYKLTNMGNDEYFNTYKGKMPSPNDWAMLCGYREENDNDKLSMSKRSFTLKLIDRLTGYQTDEDKITFNTSLTKVEQEVMDQLGGATDCWSRVNRDDGFATSKAKIIQEASRLFDNCWSEDKNQLMINNTNEKVLKLAGSFVKKIN